MKSSSQENEDLKRQEYFISFRPRNNTFVKINKTK